MKKKIFIISILIMLLLPVKGYALTGSVAINCKTTLLINNSTTCTLSGYSNEGVSAISSQLSASGNIKISNITAASIWQGNGSDGNIQLYTDNNKSGNFPIVTFTVTASGTAGTGTVNVNGVNFSDASFNEHSIGGTTLTIKVENPPKPEPPKEEENKPVPTPPTNNTETKPENNQKNNDATLKSLSLNVGTINFTKDVLEYDVKVDNKVTSITIKAEANNSKSKVTIPEDLALKVGKNTFEIKVEAEDKTVKIYKINVTRLEEVLSNNTNLLSLTIEGHNIKFNKDTKFYEIGNIEEFKLNIKTVVEDKKSKVEIFGNENLTKNDAIVIKVTAEDGTIGEYILYVNNINTSKDKKINISFIVTLGLLIISIIGNLFLLRNKKLKNKQTKVIDEEPTK